MFPQIAADVNLLLSATDDPVVQDLLDVNKLVRDVRRSSAQSLHFHPFNETPWQQLVFVSWADVSDRPRPDGSRTGGYMINLFQVFYVVQVVLISLFCRLFKVGLITSKLIWFVSVRFSLF